MIFFCGQQRLRDLDFVPSCVFRCNTETDSGLREGNEKDIGQKKRGWSIFFLHYLQSKRKGFIPMPESTSAHLKCLAAVTCSWRNGSASIHSCLFGDMNGKKESEGLHLLFCLALPKYWSTHQSNIKANICHLSLCNYVLRRWRNNACMHG